MKVYRIRPNSNHVQSVIPRNIPEGQFLDLMRFDCIRKMNAFTNIKWYIFNPKHPKGDFFTGITGALIFDKKVYDSELFTAFEMSGEVLPINMENADKLYVLNVMECFNSLDCENTTWELYSDGTRSRILKYAFYKNSFSESSLFKIPEESQTEIFTYAGVKDPDDEFYHLYQKSGFEGLTFEEVYDSDDNK